MSQLSFQCSICSESFDSAKSLGAHVESHDKPKAFRCGFCEEQFHEYDLLLTHIAVSHGNLPFLYSCTICKVKFQMLNILEKHVLHCHKNKSSEAEPPASVSGETGEKGCTDDPGTGEGGGNKDDESDEEDKYFGSLKKSKDASGLALDSKAGCSTKKKPASGASRKTSKTSGGVKRLKPKKNEKHQPRLDKTAVTQYRPLRMKNPVGVTDRLKEKLKGRQILPSPGVSAGPQKVLSLNDLKKASRKKAAGGTSLGSVESQVDSIMKTEADANNSFRCTICAQSFDEMRKLGEHIRSHSIEESYSIQCVQCKTHFDNLLALKKHLTDTDCKGFSCPTCDTSFGLEAVLIRHVVHAHKDKEEMKCETCGKVFTDRNAWARHEGTHAKSLQFVCTVCKKRFVNLEGVRRHIKAQHHSNMGPQKTIQDSLDSSFYDKDLYPNEDSSANINSVIPLKDLKTEMSSAPPEVQPPSVHALSLTDLTGNDTDHFQIQSSSRPAQSNSLVDSDDGSTPCCKVCFQMFGTEEELNEHVSSHEIDDCYSIQCIMCKVHFNSMASLDRHVTHTDCKGFFCSECHISFGLEAHLLKHNVHVHKKGATDMKCGECDKTFTKYGAWARHEANHVKFKQFVCKLCGESVSTLDHMQKSHLLRKHKVYIKSKQHDQTLPKWEAQNESGAQVGLSFSCKICSESFTNPEELDLHVSSHLIEECYHIQCPKCKIYVDDEEMLEKHLKETDCPGFVCSICEKSFALEYSLCKHMVQVHKVTDKDMKCEKCGHKSKNINIWAYHEAGHAQCQYECKICNKKSHSHKIFHDTHMPRVHNIRTSKMTTGSSRSRKKKAEPSGFKVWVNCDLCGGKSPDPPTLATHRTFHFMDGKFKIQCSGCPETFSQLHELNSHVQQRQCTKYYCYECRLYFSTEHDFVLHRIERHERLSYSGMYQCYTCRKNFVTYADFVAHAVEEHVASKPFSCLICNATFSSYVSLRAHLNKVHTLIEDEKDQVDFRCFKCLATFGSKEALNVHRWFHRNPKLLLKKEDGTVENESSCPTFMTPFFCQVCNIGFSRSYDFHEHCLHSTKVDEKSECPTCKELVSSKNLKQHMVKHAAKLLCTYCGRVFHNKQTLRNHTLVCHSDVNPFQCNICHKSLSSALRLTQHMYLHTGYKPFECKICGKRFTLQNLLESHIGTHSQKKLYKCQFCDYKCRHKTQLSTHMDRHKGIKRFICHICGKRFATASSRASHIRRHNGEKYACPLCGKQFASKFYIESHMRTHTKEKPFQCPKCEISFAMASNLNSHVKKVHGDQFFKWFQEQKKMSRFKSEGD